MANLASRESHERLAAFASAVERGAFDLSSPDGLLQDHLNVPEPRLRRYGDVLLSAPDVEVLVVALRCAAETAARISAEQPIIEVAWTSPISGRPGVRTTGGVAREIIEASRLTLLVVGYRVTVDPGLSGLASQTIEAIARAGERGVTVTAVLDREANRQALLQAWRGHVSAPSIFTWPIGDDAKASLHAKLLIADRKDALITSANLTYHGYERNLEMGIRVTGRAASEIHDRIHELIAADELVPWQV